MMATGKVLFRCRRIFGQFRFIDLPTGTRRKDVAILVVRSCSGNNFRMRIDGRLEIDTGPTTQATGAPSLWDHLTGRDG